MRFLALLTLAVTAGALFLLAKLFANFQPSRKRVQEDLEKMKRELEPFTVDLVPLDQEELELFSSSQINQLLKKRFVTTARGVFTSIYNEPLVAYSYKKYLSTGLNAILFARTARNEFLYRFKAKTIELRIDGKLVGVINNKGVLHGARTGKMLARLSEQQNELFPVVVKNREVGNLVKALPAPSKKGLSLRAFEFVKEDLSEEEETLFLSMAVLEMVKRSVG